MDGIHWFIPAMGEPAIDALEAGLDQILDDRSDPTLQNSDVLPSSSRARDEIRSIYDVRTLQDCLVFFSMPGILPELDGSLERVRKRQVSAENHECLSKDIDKKLQKMSFRYHPDRVSNRGGTPAELLEAQMAQTAINATRTVLSILGEDFLGDLDIDHKYKFYAKLELKSLGNEEEIKRHVRHVLHKTVWLSEIQQVHIIAQIRMFLSESRQCLQSYIGGDVLLFKKHRDYALYHLNKCIDGYDKLLTEFKIIIEECRKEHLGDIGSIIKEMEIKSEKESEVLKSLRNVAELSLAGQFQVFSQWDNLDDYLILPFVYYLNTMLMCSLMLSKKHKNPFNVLSYTSTFNKYVPLSAKKELEVMLNHATELAYELYNEYHSKPSNIYDEKKASEETLKHVFDNFMKKSIMDELKNRFQIEAYVEGGNRNFIARHCSNFMNVAGDIDEKVMKLLQDMEESKTMNEEIQRKYAQAMKLSCGFEKNIEESLEQSQALHEEVSKAVSKNLPVGINKEISAANGSDEMEGLIAECFEQSKMLQEEVSKILNRGKETVENFDEISSRTEDIFTFDKRENKLVQVDEKSPGQCKGQSKKVQEEVFKILNGGKGTVENFSEISSRTELTFDKRENKLVQEDENCP